MEPDPFSIPQRASEQTNWYAARMVYLLEDAPFPYNGPIPDPAARSLKPPSLFMSRRRAKTDSAIQRRHGGSGTSGSNGTGVAGAKAERLAIRTMASDGKPNAGMGRRNNVKATPTAAAAETDANAPHCWTLTKQAGVWFWLNRVTGECTDEPPHPGMAAPRGPGHGAGNGGGGYGGNGHRGMLSVRRAAADTYDHSPLEEAMRILDGKQTVVY
ncbi:unnamed protein product [Phaeothamnion confervicola]